MIWSILRFIIIICKKDSTTCQITVCYLDEQDVWLNSVIIKPLKWFEIITLCANELVILKETNQVSTYTNSNQINYN